MPFSDFVRTLNSPNGVFPKHYASTGLDQPFVATEGRVFLQYANIRLESRYLPIVELATGKIHGHAASFQAFGLSTRIPVLSEAVFVLPTDDEEFIYLDRLVRTLHALNYLTKPSRGNLLLKVHSRHVLSVPADHGLAFEEILKPCGLFPEQITLEIEIDATSDTDRLIRAIRNYQSRGYAIAASRFGRNHLDFGLLREVRPEIVKLDPLLIDSPRPLSRIVDNLRRLPGKVLLEGRDVRSLKKSGLLQHIDLLQTHKPFPHWQAAQEEAITAGQSNISSAA